MTFVSPSVKRDTGLKQEPAIRVRRCRLPCRVALPECLDYRRIYICREEAAFDEAGGD